MAAMLMGLAARGGPAPAQDAAPPYLVADRIIADRAAGRLLAEGKVTVVSGETILEAPRIVYDAESDRVRIQGPIRLRTGGDVRMIADAAEISADLRDGILQGARILFAERLQVASAAVTRREGRWLDAYGTVASACRICGDGPPLWQIRARRITHDARTRRILFRDARLEIAGVPVLWLPALGIPDPTVRRASGLLRPGIRNSSITGFTLRLPWFQTLGPHADVTIAPMLTTKGGRGLDLRLRRRLREGGWIDAEGAVTSDRLTGQRALRGYIFAAGELALPRGYRLGLRAEQTSSRAYLEDYGYATRDRLESGLSLTRYRRDEATELVLRGFRLLRTGSNGARQPGLMLAGDWQRRIPLGRRQELRLGLTALGYRREESNPVPGPARDAARLGARIAWQRQDIIGPGLALTLGARADADVFFITQDPAFPATVSRVVPQLGAELRWPLVRTTAEADWLVEPIAALHLAPQDIPAAPNEDSTQPELDEANLHAFTQSPGGDVRERGGRLALGVSLRRDGRSSSLGLSVGRILRLSGSSPFSAYSPLGGRRSDWLVAGELSLANGLELQTRALLKDDLSARQNETRLAWALPRGRLAATWTWLEADPPAGRPTDTSEITADLSWRLQRGLEAAVGWSYDLAAATPTQASLTIGWSNECVRLDLSLSRRYVSSGALQPDTTVGLGIELIGLGGATEDGVPNRCLR